MLLICIIQIIDLYILYSEHLFLNKSCIYYFGHFEEGDYIYIIRDHNYM